MSVFDKPFDFKEAEERIYKWWEKSGFFAPERHETRDKRHGVSDKRHATGDKGNEKVFSMVLPPPNVTGTLHVGHAIMVAIEDILVRYHRMKGDRTLWIPGTDHAAIATQEKVEKEIYKKEGKSRHDLGREEFLRRVERYAQASHDTIVSQIRRMGASVDWSREAFTLDAARSLAVKTAFKRMYDAGLIYRGERIVNWDPKMQTTVSDDEVVWLEEKAPFYYLKYGPFVIATARPETKFGDKYVVMNPSDKRYAKWENGQRIEVEWINGKITATVIKDKAIDPKFGTGVMTITPWHDATDFEIAERHKLDKEQIIDLRGKLMPIAGEFAGKKIAEARPLIVKRLMEKGLMERVDENYTHRVATSQRGGGKIEPQIMRQWFIGVTKNFELKTSHIKGIKSGSETTLKEIMTKAVKGGQIKIIPKRFEKIYFHWIKNLRDWCISRQIWYGHRIPVWYCLSCSETTIEPKIKSTWFLVRHGQTDWNKDGKTMGHTDIPLNDEGKRQAEYLAHLLKDKKIELILSSDLKRAKETAEIISRSTGAKIIFDSSLRERYWGNIEGMRKEEWQNKYTDKELTEAIGGGESFYELEERVKRAFDKYRKTNDSTNIVIVSHGGPLRILVKNIKKLSVEESFDFRASNASIVQLDIGPRCKKCNNDVYEQDPDTLDTWFSSGLWPFSTLNWPKETEELKNYFPTTVLETGYDILFFWVARMILMSGFHLGDIPFKTVYLHGLVRDVQGRKMSKSLGNVIDPMEFVEKYGADALRMAMIVGNAPGSDLSLSDDKVRGYRNFATKIWNIARFISMNNTQELKGIKPKLTAGDKKTIKDFEKVRKEIEKHIESFELHLAAEKIYHYIWHTFADKVVESAKPRLKDGTREEKAGAIAILKEIFLGSLKALHPFMPFVTEEIYQHFKNQEDSKSIMIQSA